MYNRVFSFSSTSCKLVVCMKPTIFWVIAEQNACDYLNNPFYFTHTRLLNDIKTNPLGVEMAIYDTESVIVQLFQSTYKNVFFLFSFTKPGGKDTNYTVGCNLFNDNIIQNRPKEVFITIYTWELLKITNHNFILY